MDNSRLKQLFIFETEFSKFHNDTDSDIKIKGPDNKNHPLKPGSIIIFKPKPKNENLIPNLDTLNYSNKSVECVEFYVNLRSIITKYTDKIRKGQILRGIEFLDFHYKQTNKKKEFIQFVKYYILTKCWVTSKNKDMNTIFDEPVKDWIAKQEKKMLTKRILFVIVPAFVLIIVGAIWIEQYRAVIVGAIIGILATQIVKLTNRIIE